MQAAYMKQEIPRTYQYDGTWKPIRFWTEDDYNVVYSVDDNDEGDDEKQELNMEPCAIMEDLISRTEEYYTILNPNSEVNVIKQTEESDSD
jgi:hypothetical protein